VYNSAPAQIASEDCFRYYVMDAPGIGVTPGYWDLRGGFSAHIGQVDLRDRSVLDIGRPRIACRFGGARARACRSTW
jgi:hypothetical protein